jgi:hypothetical protein
VVNSFIGGSTDYYHGGNEDFDNTLLVMCFEGSRRLNYYYWKNEESVPLGAEKLLKFLESLQSETIAYDQNLDRIM